MHVDVPAKDRARAIPVAAIAGAGKHGTAACERAEKLGLAFARKD
jgi:hypothetical protein